jgi:hypothetical protein
LNLAPARATFSAMEKFSPAVKFIAEAVLAAAAFGGLFWLLFWQN